MENFSTLIENSKRAVRYWWLLLIIGIALFVVGILVFVYPTQSYLGMSLLFGWLMLISGILEVVLSSVNKHFITGRGWMLAGGIIEIVLGIILIFNVALSAATLPIFLGFWLMLRAFGAIGLGSDMGAMQIAGSGWTIFSGILLLLCSLWILFQPLVFGTTAVIVWVGISLLFASATAKAATTYHPKAPAAAGAFSYPALQNPETPRGTGQPITARKHPSPTAPINKGEFLRPEIDRKKLSFLRSFFLFLFYYFCI